MRSKNQKTEKMRLCDLTFLLLAVWLYAYVINAIALEDNSLEMPRDNYLALRSMLLDGMVEKFPFLEENRTPKRGTGVKQVRPDFIPVRGRRSKKKKAPKGRKGFVGVRGK
ncbi:hypothetical protein JTE90_024260 [Oedothorax gibbosus]|uniref:Uncharacterized protein n=1 Tax=Oedothorax gibbosus TaxID=931172 RepID=A0AAV6VQU4_9ARAC|nr:hypothetical protein JTE90_024260 [Oedothorax gibbosus]